MSLNSADTDFVAGLARQLPDGVLTPPEPRYLTERRALWQGHAGVVARPRSTEEVATIVCACAIAKVGVVPWGGGTGLVGGQIMPAGPLPVVLSMERMAALRGVYPQENVLIAEAGMILADVQAQARAADRLFPLSLASEGSAQIGGNLSSNAGGVNVLRYGNARDLCLGVEAVLPDGSVLHGLKRLRKDNTGYDLRGLLIGAEGTLGVITAASLKLAPQPASHGTALLVVESPEAALALLARAQSQIGGLVSAFEMISGVGLRFLAETLPDVRLPFAEPPDWSVLIEVGLPEGLDPSTVLETLFAAGLEEGLVSDGVIAASEGQRQDFWRIREMIPEANRLIGSISSHDISLPLGAIPEFIGLAGPALEKLGAFRINCFGHLGDGNLHYNVFPPKGGNRADHDNSREAIKARVHDLVDQMGGSFSAEHGIGRLKVGELEHYGDPAKLAAMRAIKAALDPDGIMNPGAVLRG
ncbi:MAG: hydroxyacid dehydrogenase [Cereibacter sphaeroides]|uniref:Hydroxyacid dehydrogenase n=1 Tax=Cereibacter sphaeroides TaxID=1063 RepID=A0A2W5SEM0_CERSP|nr:MAG: hydroxyacid dehydrogenase [Cereibacter sphaeroides]